MTPWIPLVSAIVSALVAGAITYVNNGLQRAADREAASRKTQAEFRRGQLNELYAPLYMQRHRSFSLRKALKQTEADQTRWRLVHHIGDARTAFDAYQAGNAHPGFEVPELEAIPQIMAVGDEIVALILSKAGFIEGPIPDSFVRYVEHQALLKHGWKSAKNQTPGRSQPFPDKIDDDIDDGLRKVRSELDRVLQPSDPSKTPRVATWVVALVLMAAAIAAIWSVTRPQGQLATLSVADGVICGEVSTGSDDRLRVAERDVGPDEEVTYVSTCGHDGAAESKSAGVSVPIALAGGALLGWMASVVLLGGRQGLGNSPPPQAPS